MLVFVTDPERPRKRTLAIARALAGRPALVLFRDKRAKPDLLLLAELVARAPVVVNAGKASPELARTFGALGWHAPEAVWRVDPDAAGALSLADHDGAGVAFAAAHRVPLVLVSPIWIHKGRPARGLAPFAGRAAVLRVGLGGVEHGGHAEQLAAAGADGVAVQRALYAALDLAARIGELLAPFPQTMPAPLSR